MNIEVSSRAFPSEPGTSPDRGGQISIRQDPSVRCRAWVLMFIMITTIVIVIANIMRLIIIVIVRSKYDFCYMY